MQFWEKLFPEFFNHIHEAIKAASKNNEAIRQIFKEFLFVPSAMIDSSTPCILINTSKNYDPPNQCFTNINQVELENFYRVDEKLTKFIAPISENVSLIRLIDCNQSFIGFVQIINLAKNVMSLVIDGQNVLCGYELEIKLFQKMETLKNEKTKKIHDKFEKVCDEYLTRVKKVTKMVNGTFIKLCAIILDGNLSWSPSLLENLSNTHNNILTGQTTDVIKVQKKVISEFSGLLADKDNCFAEIADELLTHLHKLINLEKRMNEQSEINMEMKGFLNDLVTSMSDSLTDSDDHIIDLFIQSLQKSLTEFAIHFESKFAQYDTPYNFIKSLLPGVLKD